jgi:hypothetical protein
MSAGKPGTLSRSTAEHPHDDARPPVDADRAADHQVYSYPATRDRVTRPSYASVKLLVSKIWVPELLGTASGRSGNARVGRRRSCGKRGPVVRRPGHSASASGSV